MAKIGIVGYGFVGQAVEHIFRGKGNSLLIFDKFKAKDTLEDLIKNSEYIFICLPTPNKGKRIDLSIIDQTLAKIAKQKESRGKIVIIKSTVIPGTTKKYAKKYKNLSFVFCPEFLREATFLKDALKQDRIVIGNDSKVTLKKVQALFRKRFPRTKIFLTDPTAAEMVKYMANTFLATKVIFANEIFELCHKLKVDYPSVAEMTGSDKRIGAGHLSVTNDRGFGGKCFPKDIVAFIGLFDDLGADASILKTVWQKNLKIRKNRDWEKIPFVKS